MDIEESFGKWVKAYTLMNTNYKLLGLPETVAAANAILAAHVESEKPAPAAAAEASATEKYTPVTEKQIAFLQDLKVKFDPQISKKEAATLISNTLKERNE